MAIALKTFKGGNVTPQDDAIIYQTVLPGAGIFKGCEVSFASSNVLHISQGCETFPYQITAGRRERVQYGKNSKRSSSPGFSDGG